MYFIACDVDSALARHTRIRIYSALSARNSKRMQMKLNLHWIVCWQLKSATFNTFSASATTVLSFVRKCPEIQMFFVAFFASSIKLKSNCSIEWWNVKRLLMHASFSYCGATFVFRFISLCFFTHTFICFLKHSHRSVSSLQGFFRKSKIVFAGAAAIAE